MRILLSCTGKGKSSGAPAGSSALAGWSGGRRRASLSLRAARPARRPICDRRPVPPSAGRAPPAPPGSGPDQAGRTSAQVHSALLTSSTYGLGYGVSSEGGGQHYLLFPAQGLIRQAGRQTMYKLDLMQDAAVRQVPRTGHSPLQERARTVTVRRSSGAEPEDENVNQGKSTAAH